MIEPTLTAEDLTLYALHLLESDERTRVDAMLRKSTAAREELAYIRGDLALFALATEQHTPQAMTRQRLLQQVARERRTVPVRLPVEDDDRIPAEPLVKPVRRAGEDPDATHAARESTGSPPMQAPVTAPTRTFPARTQQSLESLPEAQTVRGQQARSETAQPRSSNPTTPLADPLSFTADRKTFSPDPEVYPREARSLGSSAPAHSVTMFEQHFASEGGMRSNGRERPSELESNARGRRNTMEDALGGVQDRFVPSSGTPEGPGSNFALSSYREHDTLPGQQNALGHWVSWSGWAVALTMAVIGLISMHDDFNLREQVSRQAAQMTETQRNALKAQAVLQTLESPSTQRFLVARTDAAPAPGGRVAYLPEQGTLIFQGSNLEALQPYKTYELWLIPAGEGHQPVPAGLFKPDARGYATVVMPQMTRGLIAANFGVTIEDEGGASTPTLPILLVGQQS